MGLTIHYRGRLDDPGRVEDLEDRVLDLVLDLGGSAHIWRSAADDRPEGMVRGLTVDLFPGQETTSLLVASEGWLIPLFSVEAAERGEIVEAPWCSVKTQFGPPEGHVALIELLSALKKEFISNLEVRDEGDCWEQRNVDTLLDKFRALHTAIRGMAGGLEQFGLSKEAAEDPQILSARIERIARQVQRSLSRPSEHAPVQFGAGDDQTDWDDDDPGTEREWDEMFKENRRRQERMQRHIEERMRSGDTLEEAFSNALEDAGILNLPEEDEEDEDEDDDAWSDDDPFAVDDEMESDSAAPESEEGEDWLTARERDPLVERAMDLLHRLHKLEAGSADPTAGHFGVLLRGAGDVMGGLAQATGSTDRGDLGLCIVQLKRALRGAAFARGALFPLRSARAISANEFEGLAQVVDGLTTDMTAMLTDLRERLEGDDGP